MSSEVYGPKNHRDLEFVLLGDRRDVRPNDAWIELRFVDLAGVPKEQFSRSHEDILASVGKWKPQ